MKHKSKIIVSVLLLISLIFNGVLLYYIKETEKPKPSIMKFGSGESDMVIYCDRSEDDNVTVVDYEKHTVTVGVSTILNEDDTVYFIGNNGKVDLSDYDAQGFVIDSRGNLLFGLCTPTLKKEKVYVSPNGEKYHNDIYCAGKSGFEITPETAKMFDRQPCKKCVI